MSGKSIFLSILAVLLFGAVLFGIIFIFKTSIVAGIFSLLLIALPVMLQRKAIDAADGTVDKYFAKFGVPLLAAAIGLIAILTITFWIS